MTVNVSTFVILSLVLFLDCVQQHTSNADPVVGCPDSCEDLSTDCWQSTCSNDYQKVWCAKKCKSCPLRDKCYNAAGDATCAKYKKQGICTTQNAKVICKKACTECTADSTPTPCPTSCPNSCEDLTTDCHLSNCSSEHTRIWCAKTCNSCPLRNKCYNADGDSSCNKWAAMGMCLTAPFTNVICKKACLNCTADSPPTPCPTQPPSCPPTCEDLTTDCHLSTCSTEHQKVWCAKTCNTCSLRDKCYNADPDANCTAWADMGMCLTSPNTRVICKKACTQCTMDSPPSSICSTPAPTPTQPPTPTTPCVNSCQDLTTDCHLSSCSDDYTKVWCAQKCNACPLRNKCYNAASDVRCSNWAAMGMCITAPFTSVVCKKACTECVEDSPAPPCVTSTTPPTPTCEDLSTDCRFSLCSNDYQKLWCANSCQTCPMRDICYNGAGDSECATYKDFGMCQTTSAAKVICKKACTGCA